MHDSAHWIGILVTVLGAIMIVKSAFSVLMMVSLERVRILKEKGKTEAAYRLARTLIQVARRARVRRSSTDWFLPVLLLRASELAEALGDADAGFRWAEHLLEDGSATSYRAIALQRQAVLRRKQNRNNDARVLEEKALALSAVFKGDNKNDSYASTWSETVGVTVLISHGRFHDALKRIDADWQHTSDPQRVGWAAQRAVIYRAMGRYNEALAAQNDMETRYEKIANPNSTVRTINQALYKIHKSWNVTSRLTCIGICLDAGNPGAASEIWDALPAEVIDDSTEALRYATGAWLFAVRGNEEAARRLIADQPVGSSPEQQMTIAILQGRALFALCDYGAAIERFQTALVACAGKPLTEAEIRTSLAACYVKQEKYNLAATEYEKVIAAGFEEAWFTQEARTQMARLRASCVGDGEAVRLRVMNR